MLLVAVTVAVAALLCLNNTQMLGHFSLSAFSEFSFDGKGTTTAFSFLLFGYGVHFATAVVINIWLAVLGCQIFFCFWYLSKLRNENVRVGFDWI